MAESTYHQTRGIMLMLSQIRYDSSFQTLAVISLIKFVISRFNENHFLRKPLNYNVLNVLFQR